MINNNAPAVASHGTSDGTIIGAIVLLDADIDYQKLINSLEATAAKYATALADTQTQIQSQLSALQSEAAKDDDIAAVEARLKIGKPNDGDAGLMQDYTTKLGLDQSEIQAAVKGIDPVLTTEQNQPSALQQGANEFIQEVGTVNQGMQALANDRIG